ncbi:MAG: alpha-2-macroglobulin family protein [Desulfobacteraceae bacterium]|nr:alpha-2-macroglobulin family protein [Desulfobacteraceae bacterium]
MTSSPVLPHLLRMLLLIGVVFCQPLWGADFDGDNVRTEAKQQINTRLSRQHYQGQKMKVSSVAEETWENGAALVVRVTVPVDDRADWRRYLTVRRADRIEPSDHWVRSKDGLAVIYPFVAPGKVYNIKIKPGLPAVNGKAVVRPGQHSVKTRRIKPAASFAGDGHVLSTGLRRALPVTTFNVDEVDLDLFRITPEKIGTWSHFTGSQRRRFYHLNNFSENNTLVHSARFPIEHRQNQRTTTNLDLSDIKALEKPGAYLAVLRVPGQYESNLETCFFTVSDIGLQIRSNDRRMHVYTHSIQSDELINGVTLSLYNGSELIARKVVDGKGESVFDAFHREGQTLLARSGDQITVLRYDRNPLDLSGYDNALTRHAPHQVFAWSPRDLYRPGETVNIHALLKDYDGRAVDPVPLQMRLLDATGSRIITKMVNRDDSGRYDFRHTLGESAKTGTWRLAFSIPGNDRVLSEYEFSVEDFLPERMELTLFDGDSTSRRHVAERSAVIIPVQGDYLYGAPASGNNLDGFAVAEIDRHPFAQWKTYFFGLEDEPISNPRRAIPEARLDSSGAAEVEVPVRNWTGVQSPLVLTASISLYESGGRPVTRSTTVTNILAEKLVGLEPQFKDRPDNNSRAGFKAVLTNARGEMLAGKGYQVRLLREDRNYYWTYSDSNGWRWHFDPLDYEVYSVKLDFDGKVPTGFNMPVEWGNYRLEIFDNHNKLVNRFRFSTRWSGWSSTSSDSLKPDQVLMTFRNDRYQAGDDARVQLVPPVDGRAMITVESNDGVLWRNQIDVSAKGTELTFPIREGWDRHDLYLTATVLTPGDMTHSVAPKRAFGFTHLPIERADARLDLSIEAPERIQPRRPVEVQLRLNDKEIPAGPVWVSVAAVDVGVLNITRFKTPDPAAYLFGARRYDYQFYDIYGRIIDNAGYNYSAQRFGGGFKQSEAELTRGGEKPDNVVKIVSLESEPVRFDAGGRARLSLDVPDFNGRLRWMAVAWSSGSYASAEDETQVADPVVTRLSRPRFLALGDECRLTLDISNQSGKSQSLDVDFKVSGALQSNSWTQSLTLSDSAKETLTFPVKAAGLGNAPIEAHIRTGDGAIDMTKKWSLGTRSAYPSVTRKEQAVLEKGETWSPGLSIDDLVAHTVNARLVVSPRPPIDISSQFDALLRYPYGCTEQSTSSGFPWALMSPEAAERFGLKSRIEKQFEQPYTDRFRREQLEAAVGRVMRRQNATGGFGSWSSDGTEMNWLTVYVADFLTTARDAGAQVPNDALNLTLDRLDAYLRGRVNVSAQWSTDNNYSEFATRAYAAYVMACSNRAGLAHLRRLYEQADGVEDRSGLPWAQLGYALQDAGDQELADKAFARARTTEYQAGYYGYYGSALRDSALVYALLARVGRAEDQQLLDLFENVRERRWLSTQERNALFRAAVAGAGKEELTTRARLTTSGFEQLIDQEDAFKTLIDAAEFSSLKSVESLSGTLYISLELVGEQKTAPEPVSNEMSIERNFFDPEGRPLAADSLKSGDLVIVGLVARSKRSIPDGLVVDLLPAGLELENQNLDSASVDLSKLTLEGESIADWRQNKDLLHVEYRDDRFVAAAELDEHRVTRFYYLARAVTPGQYQVPPPYIEDMYRPYYHAVGTTPARLVIKP